MIDTEHFTYDRSWEEIENSIKNALNYHSNPLDLDMAEISIIEWVDVEVIND